VDYSERRSEYTSREIAELEEISLHDADESKSEASGVFAMAPSAQ
jgi:hypothetical protein